MSLIRNDHGVRDQFTSSSPSSREEYTDEYITQNGQIMCSKQILMQIVTSTLDLALNYGSAYKHGRRELQQTAITDTLAVTFTRLPIAHTWTNYNHGHAHSI